MDDVTVLIGRSSDMGSQALPVSPVYSNQPTCRPEAMILQFGDPVTMTPTTAKAAEELPFIPPGNPGCHALGGYRGVAWLGPGGALGISLTLLLINLGEDEPGGEMERNSG